MQMATPGIGIILSCLNLTWFSRILRGALLLLARRSEVPKKDGEVQKHAEVQKVSGDVAEFKKDT